MKSSSSWVIAMGRVNGNQVVYYLPFSAIKSLPYTVGVTHKNMSKNNAEISAQWFGAMMGIPVKEFNPVK